MKFVKADEKELPNNSPDSFIQYYGNNKMIKNYIIYGTCIIKDTDTGKIYRLKRGNIIERLSAYLKGVVE